MEIKNARFVRFNKGQQDYLQPPCEGLPIARITRICFYRTFQCGKVVVDKYVDL